MSSHRSNVCQKLGRTERRLDFVDGALALWLGQRDGDFHLSDTIAVHGLAAHDACIKRVQVRHAQQGPCVGSVEFEEHDPARCLRGVGRRGMQRSAVMKCDSTRADRHGNGFRYGNSGTIDIDSSDENTVLMVAPDWASMRTWDH